MSTVGGGEERRLSLMVNLGNMKREKWKGAIEWWRVWLLQASSRFFDFWVSFSFTSVGGTPASKSLRTSSMFPVALARTICEAPSETIFRRHKGRQHNHKIRMEPFWHPMASRMSLKALPFVCYDRVQVQPGCSRPTATWKSRNQQFFRPVRQ